MREVAGLAAKIDREEAYHRMHAQMWHERLKDEPRYAEALEELRPLVDQRDEPPARVRAALERDDRGAPLGRGSDVVTEAQVWEALAEIPDPEIPPISIVDLGVVRDVSVENGTVHVEFTPTFLGCPALEVMRDQMAERIRELGAEPDVEVILDDSWSTDRITPAGREKLRESGFAPPAPRQAGGPQLVQLQSKAFKCPYCGSTRRAWRTSSARRRAARCATARAAASRSSSSRPSDPLQGLTL